jgi:hypothetical protein
MAVIAHELAQAGVAGVAGEQGPTYRGTTLLHMLLGESTVPCRVVMEPLEALVDLALAGRGGTDLRALVTRQLTSPDPGVEGSLTMAPKAFALLSRLALDEARQPSSLPPRQSVLQALVKPGMAATLLAPKQRLQLWDQLFASLAADPAADVVGPIKEALGRLLGTVEALADRLAALLKEKLAADDIRAVMIALEIVLFGGVAGESALRPLREPLLAVIEAMARKDQADEGRRRAGAASASSQQCLTSLGVRGLRQSWVTCKSWRSRRSRSWCRSGVTRCWSSLTSSSRSSKVSPLVLFLLMCP